MFIMPGEIPKHPLCGGGCTVTHDRTYFDDADAVVFMMKSAKRNDLPDPKKRRPNQAFVWWSRESAWTAKYLYRKSLDDFDDYFNWTMTHRRDSDVNGMLYPFVARDFVKSRLKETIDAENDDLPRDYGIVEAENLLFGSEDQRKDNQELEIKIHDVIARKTGVVAWVASNCAITEGAKQRFIVVQQLQRLGVGVDIYGHCGNLTFGSKGFYPTLADYKFYLAFENGVHCRGYITEKLWYNAFYSGAVPVVWGPPKSDVEDIAPPGSFIHYDDFNSPEELAEYLKHLDTNMDAYTKYFEWRWKVPGYYPLLGVNDYKDRGLLTKHKNHFDNAFCELCRFIKGGVNQVYHKTVPSLKKFWFDADTDDCLKRN
ncbi:alpha-(1,3)-fucosyltransferase 7-like [Ciona intestinalis]